MENHGSDKIAPTLDSSKLLQPDGDSGIKTCEELQRKSSEAVGKILTSKPKLNRAVLAGRLSLSSQGR
jgi:hypothetical protein